MYKLSIAFLAVAIILGLASCGGDPASKSNNAMPPSDTFDWQGHRGMRGLLPENTIPAFVGALAYPAITTLELDVVVSKDGHLIVSHEPWFSEEICSHPDGRPVSASEAKTLNIYRMTAEEISAFDCGLRPHSRFPDQRQVPAYKPRLSEVVEAVESRVRGSERAPVAYNIELKSLPEWYGTFVPDPVTFVRLALAEIKALGIAPRTCIQSFDKRILQEVHLEDPEMTTALLIENIRGVQRNVAELGYVPSIYSPYYLMVTQKVVDSVHEKGMKIIPWTVNDTASMRALMDMGVDGIITDYVDRTIE